MNKNSMRDVTIYYAHDILGYTAPELSKIYGIGAPYIRRIVSKVRDVENGKLTHGPTSSALKQMKRDYSIRNLKSIKELRNFTRKLNRDINAFMSSLILNNPEIQDLPFVSGIGYASDNLEYTENFLDDELGRFLHRYLAD